MSESIFQNTSLSVCVDFTDAKTRKTLGGVVVFKLRVMLKTELLPAPKLSAVLLKLTLIGRCIVDPPLEQTKFPDPVQASRPYSK